MFQIGDILDQYRLTAEIGAGSYGRVFAAENIVTHQIFALKVVSLAGNAGRREVHALQLYRDLDHPNLLKVHHVGITQDFLYYTMDLADGKLAEQNFSARELLDAAAKIADALACLHHAGLLHRDIKPDNLLYRNGEPLLADVGLLTRESQATFTGTPGFLSPKIWQKGLPPDENTDLYAFAKSFYCLLSGNAPRFYPRYQGEMTPEASRLLRSCLAICDGEKTFPDAQSVADYLRNGKNRYFIPRRTLCRNFFKFAIAAGSVALLGGIIFFGVVKPLRARGASRAAKRTEALQKQRLAAEEQRRQEETKRWIKYRMAAQEYALQKIPLHVREDGSKYTTLDDEIDRSLLEIEYMESNPQ